MLNFTYRNVKKWSKGNYSKLYSNFAVFTYSVMPPNKYYATNYNYMIWSNIFYMKNGKSNHYEANLKVFCL